MIVLCFAQSTPALAEDQACEPMDRPKQSLIADFLDVRNHYREKEVQQFNAFLNSSSKYLDQLSCGRDRVQRTRLLDLNASNETCEHTEKFCAQVDSSVKSELGTVDTFVSWKVNACHPGLRPSEIYVVKQRESNFNYAAERFTALTQDFSLQTECCGTNEACKKKWAATPLEVLVGLGVGAYKVQFLTHAPYSVQVATATIAGCETADCIDGFFYHELGHACSYWRAVTIEGNAENFKNKAVILSAIKNRLGSAGADCVQKGIESYYQGTKSEFRDFIDLGEWYQEAYADILFGSHWETSHLSWACNAIEDSNHVQVKAYLGCMLKYLPTMKKRFCSADDSTKPQSKRLRGRVR